MKKYIIASVRGKDFIVEAMSPDEAWVTLCAQEMHNGSLWKTSDSFRNRVAVEREGFTLFNPNEYTSGAWKEIEDV